MRSFTSLLCAFGAFGILGASAQDLPADLACVDQCNNNNRDQFATHSCASAEDRECLCGADNFAYSVRDCALSTCPGTTEDQVQNWLGANFCAGLTDDSSESVATTSAEEPAATTTAAPEETSAPPETTEVETTEAPVTTTEAPAEETTSAVAESSVVTTPDPTSVASTPTSASETETETETETATPTSDADEFESEEDEKDEDEAAVAAGGGLSQGAAVGIGVGVAVVVVAIAIVAAVLLMRKRKANRQGNNPRGADGYGRDNISRPIQDPSAGIGRAYGGSDDFGEKRGESIEMTMTGHRYEDMVPRTTPRTMV